ncbi:caspase-1-like [Calliopsis andreniformis]|uniref:caspase-1-like n=1 Tax=Calliopsis andreniformis TaxID=337506 RepID=UPI003FCE92E0
MTDAHSTKYKRHLEMSEKQQQREEKKGAQATKDERQPGKNKEQPAQKEIPPVESNASSSDKPTPSTVDAWPFNKPKNSHGSVNEKEIRSKVEPHSEVYDMNHRRRGVALIFNHIEFKSMTKRNGSKKDCEDISEALGKLDFDVRVYTDPTASMIKDALKSTAAEDHRDADCLVVVAMSHGEPGFLYSSDKVYRVEMLWAPFTGDQCSSLVGKPKLFFIQACRGTQLDKPVKVTHETDSTSSYSIPAYADIMVAYSTFEGFYSWRNPDAGAWFIQALCEELNLNGRTRDLLTIMTFVNRRVAIEYQSYVPYDQKFHEKKQIPSIVSMLTRLVYFSEKSY